MEPLYYELHVTISPNLTPEQNKKLETLLKERAFKMSSFFTEGVAKTNKVILTSKENSYQSAMHSFYFIQRQMALEIGGMIERVKIEAICMDVSFLKGG